MGQVMREHHDLQREYEKTKLEKDVLEKSLRGVNSRIEEQFKNNEKFVAF